MTSQNPYERAARLNKVSRLLETIDIGLKEYLDDPREVYEVVMCMPPQWWKGLAVKADVNEPSEETVSMVLERLRERVERHQPKH